MRTATLAALESRWFSLTPNGWHYLVAGQLRDRQLELALRNLVEMETRKIHVESWLYDLFAYTFCSISSFVEVLALMRQRVNTGEQGISGTLWYHILDMASRSLELETTKYVWQQHVVQELLTPSSGMCINVLNTAARAGDISLAENVLQTLRRRGDSLHLHHYEALLETYVRAEEIAAVFAILAGMERDGIPPVEATTRPLYLYLRESSSRPAAALQLLKEKIRGLPYGSKIPICAFNAIIEASVHQDDLEFALNTFFSRKWLPVPKANTATFNSLLRGCGRLGQRDMAMRLTREMDLLNVSPDELTYDRLLLACLNARIVGAKALSGATTDGQSASSTTATTNQLMTRTDDAWRCLDEMRDLKLWPRRGTLLLFVKRCVEASDERVWGLVDEMEARGMEVSDLQVWVGTNWGKVNVSTSR